MNSAERRATVSPTLFYKLLALQLAMGVLATLGAYLVGHGQLPPGTVTTVIGYVAAAAAAGIVAYALFRVKPSLPRAEPGQNGKAYLQSPETLARVAFVWILAGGSGLMSWLGLAITGVWATAAVGVIVLIAFATLRPGALVKS